MRFLLFLLVVLVGAGPLRGAPPPVDDFARGNALYAEGKFADAAAAYETAVGRGEFSANLFYNLADSYHRLGQPGRAILNYQRALLLEPRHAEAAHNLAFVRGHAPAPASPVADESFAGWLNADAWTWTAAGGGWLAIISLGIALWRRRALALAAGMAGLALGALAGWALYRLDGGAKNPARAVVLADETRALYSPADNSKAVVVLPAGSEVLVISEQGAWDYVQFREDSRGWVAADRVEKVVPPGARSKAG